MNIRPIKKQDLVILNKELAHKTLPELHDKKLAEQEKGKSLWLIAWEGKKPMAHVQIRFNGSKEGKVKRNLKRCPHIESLGVKEKYRRKGIAKKLMRFVEKLVKKQGFSKIGLSVESDDDFLKNMYKKMGYSDWGKGVITEIWNETDKKGREHKIKEKCVYLVKDLK